MKKSRLFGTVCACLAVISYNVSLAALIPQSDLGIPVLWDDEADQYWVSGHITSDLIGKTYSEQLDQIATYNQPGSGFSNPLWGDWRMASFEDWVNLSVYEVELASGWYFSRTRHESPPWSSIDYYQGRLNEYDSAGFHLSGVAKYELFWDNGEEWFRTYHSSIEDTDTSVYAWVVADAVPLPPTLLLFSSGLALFGVFIRSKTN